MQEHVTSYESKKVSIMEVQDGTQKQLLDQINEIQRKNFDVDALAYDPDMDSHTRKVVDLKKEVEQLKLEKLQEVNAIEREKAQATENLRKEMLLKIKETKANLMAMNDEQLQTTTRLTILQNQ
jgi:phage host-nuclease inhibitor protein Gam